MAAKIPVKAIYTGSDVTSLGEFTSSDTIAGSYLTDGSVTAAKLAADAATQAELDTVSTVASAALPKAGGTLTGTVTVSANAVGTVTTDNDGTFAMSATNNFKCTPSGNFTLTFTVAGLIIGVLLVNIGFYFLKKYINQRFNEKQITTFKSFFEYTLIFLVIYFVLF